MDSTYAVLGGSFLGFLASVLPSFFAMVGEYFEHRRDMDIGAQKIDAAVKGVTVSLPFDPVPTVAANEPALSFSPILNITNPSSETLVDADDDCAPTFFDNLFDVLRSSVRPTITYGIFAVFVYIKIMAMRQGFFVDHTSAVLLLPVLWDDGTQALFAAIVTFWFGTRAFEKQEEKATAVAKVSAGDNP
jgi:hypothetical protein